MTTISSRLTPQASISTLSSRRRGLDQRPVDALVLGAGIAEAGAGVQADGVVLRRAHVLEVDALLCLQAVISTLSVLLLSHSEIHLRGFEAVRAMRPSAKTVHCWPAAVASHAANAIGAMSFQAAARS